MYDTPDSIEVLILGIKLGISCAWFFIFCVSLLLDELSALMLGCCAHWRSWLSPFFIQKISFAQMRDCKSIIVQCAGTRVTLLASQQLCHVEYCHHSTHGMTRSIISWQQIGSRIGSIVLISLLQSYSLLGLHHHSISIRRIGAVMSCVNLLLVTYVLHVKLHASEIGHCISMRL